MDHQTPYMSYLLRLWLEDDTEADLVYQQGSEWRASLEDPHTQAIQVFASIDDLFDFLLRETQLRASGENAHSSSVLQAADPIVGLPDA